MSSLWVLRIACVAAIATGGIGVALGFLSKRLPTHGWAALALLLLSAIIFVNIEPEDQGASSRYPLIFGFLISAPFASLYGGFAFKHAKDRLVTWAAAAGGVVIGALFLFYLAGAAWYLIETFFKTSQ